MTPQEKCWAVLKQDYKVLSAFWYEKMHALEQANTKQYWKVVNEFFNEIILWPIPDQVKAVKTALTVHKFALDPNRIEAFDQFHCKCGAYITHNLANLSSWPVDTK